MAFQWSCDKQSEIEAATPLDHVIEAEQRGWQLGDDIVVNEQGFDRWEGELFAGNPDWDSLLDQHWPQLTEAEQAFVDGQVYVGNYDF